MSTTLRRRRQCDRSRFYHGTYRATGKSFSASFAHIYTLRGGKIVKFVQIVDSAKVLEAMQP